MVRVDIRSTMVLAVGVEVAPGRGCVWSAAIALVMKMNAMRSWLGSLDLDRNLYAAILFGEFGLASYTGPALRFQLGCRLQCFGSAAPIPHATGPARRTWPGTGNKKQSCRDGCCHGHHYTSLHSSSNPVLRLSSTTLTNAVERQTPHPPFLRRTIIINRLKSLAPADFWTMPLRPGICAERPCVRLACSQTALAPRFRCEP